MPGKVETIHPQVKNLVLSIYNFIKIGSSDNVNLSDAQLNDLLVEATGLPNNLIEIILRDENLSKLSTIGNHGTGILEALAAAATEPVFPFDDEDGVNPLHQNHANASLVGADGDGGDGGGIGVGFGNGVSGNRRFYGTVSSDIADDKNNMDDDDDDDDDDVNNIDDDDEDDDDNYVDDDDDDDDGNHDNIEIDVIVDNNGDAASPQLHH